MIRRGIGKQGYSQARFALIDSPLLVEKVGWEGKIPGAIALLYSFLYVLFSGLFAVRVFLCVFRVPMIAQLAHFPN
jgi:hypothetical protein